MPTNPPNITALPSPPDPNDRSSFNARAYPWSVAQQTLATEVAAVAANVKGNADEAIAASGVAVAKAAQALASEAAAAASAASALNAPGAFATSTTGVAIGAGTKNLTLSQLGKLFFPGQRIIMALATDPVSTQQVGTVASNDPATGALSIVVGSGDFRGSGTFTDWVISMAGQGTNLPKPVAGDAGKLLGVSGAGTYEFVDGRGAGGAGAPAGNLVLSSASAAVQTLTGGLPGQWVQLPSATTMPTGTNLFALINKAGVDVEIRNAAGTALGFARPNATVMVNLADNSTAAGVWGLGGAAPWGVLSMNMPTGASGIAGELHRVLSVDIGRELMLVVASDGIYAAVWDGNTCTLGASTLIAASTVATSGGGTAQVRAVKIAADKFLVIFNSGGVRALVLTISGTAITVGSIATNSSVGFERFDDFVELAGVGALLLAPASGSNYPYATVFTVSGTTVTIGTPTLVAGAIAVTQAHPRVAFDLGGGRALVNFNTSFHVLTVSGATPSLGTGVTLGNDASSMAVRKLPSGRFAAIAGNSGTQQGAIITTTGATVNMSAVNLFAASAVDAFHVVGNQVIAAGSMPSVSAAAMYNVLTDSAGTAVAGVALARHASGNNQSRRLVFSGCDAISITTTRTSGNYDTMGDAYFTRIGVSGNNPVLLSVAAIYNAENSSTGGGIAPPRDASIFSPYQGMSGRDLLPVGTVAGAAASLDFSSHRYMAWQTEGNYVQMIPRPMLPNTTYYPPNRSTSQNRGESLSQMWAAQSSTGGVVSPWVVLHRIKVA
ncbi:hypothetical protein [Acidovorax sp.]|uniref:hypothetical protein n=1 Tax=Acidovorax sp. TaxID=1872122 RepID=UPI002ACED371|nr:hypothetical protein [Acidovorax sp.]MDZ7863018.1 hypothetical protein [Acidovorax sp.]